MKNLIDRIDLEILRKLQIDNTITLKDLSKEINLSLTPTFDRIKRLEKRGIIKEKVAILDRNLLNLELIVQCQVSLEKQNQKFFKEFEKEVQNIPQVLGCYLVSGAFDYLLNIICANVNDYQKFYEEKLSTLPHVAHINSIFVIKEVIRKTQLPI